MSGVAVRYAIGLGLNLRNEAKGLNEQSKEVRYRVWWAISSVERMLAVMNGRVASFAEIDCTVPPPLPLDEAYLLDSSNFHNIQRLRRWSSEGSEFKTKEHLPSTPSSSSHSRKKISLTDFPSPTSNSPPTDPRENLPPSEALFFYYHTKLGVITGEVLRRLYRASSMEESWSQTLLKIRDLDDKLQTWMTDLPKVFDFTISEQLDHVWVRQRVNLGLFYYSSTMLANRPCLCRVDGRIPNESGKSKRSNRLNAMTCVDAAIHLLSLLPDEPDTVALYALSPWWCLIHYLMQTAIVLMLELSFRAEHMPDMVEEVFSSSKKVLKWLREMSSNDIAAYRAWHMCDEMLRKVAPKVGKVFDEPPPIQAISDAKVILDGISAQLSLPHDSHGYPASMPGQPPVFSSYDQYSNPNTLPTSMNHIEFADMFPTADEMDAMNFGDDAARGFFGPPRTSENPGW